MKKAFNFLISELGRIIIGTVLFVTAVILEHLEKDVASLLIFIATLLVAGAPVFIGAVKGLIRRDLLDEKFLMSIASIGAMFVGEASEGAAVMLFFLVGEYFEHKAVMKSRKSIRALMNIRPDEATVIVNGIEAVIDADEVEVGTTIIVRTGERVPIDSRVISGSADVDTSLLTGESIPQSVSEGCNIDAGAVVINGVLIAETLRCAEESAAARILDLVENANERKSKTENFITEFSHYYTPIVVSLAVLIAIIPSLFGLTEWSESIYRALIFLVISCPCALVISVPMAFFGGIGAAASNGILYKGGNTFSALARADTFVFDKTGTLTNGEFSVDGIYPVGVTSEELLFFAASAEYGSNHPIATCIKHSTDKMATPETTAEFAGRGIEATVNGYSIRVGTRSFIEEKCDSINLDKEPLGAVYVLKNGEFIGYITVRDKIKTEAKSTVSKLLKMGAVKTVMLSGDRTENAKKVAHEVGISEVYSELLPENKYSKLENIIKNSKGTVYVGDGINDVPSISLADVGVAMGRLGSDAAIEAADVVITSDNLEKIPKAVRIARKTVRISKENIVFALGVKMLILVLGALGVANMWLAVFADVGVAALAILNSMRTLKK